ncbi:MAG: hypothetical protein KJ767_00565 [Nanoarchaeota archaeon]|nr:hypothetical protein [Nanoarchaeota archaeon]
MKKEILLAMLILLIGVNFVSATECIDSDGAENYIVKGTTTGVHDPTTGIVETVTDFCNDDWVNEYGCGIEIGFPEDVIVGTSAKCPYGCEDGACIINPESGKAFREIVKCTDSDEGINFNISGQLTLIYDDGYTETLEEGCGHSSGSGEYGARDFSCDIFQGKPSYGGTFKSCKCENGICVEGCLCEGTKGWNYDGVCEPEDCEFCPDCLKVVKVDDKTAEWGKEKSGGYPTTLKLIDFNQSTEKARFQRRTGSTQRYNEWFSENDCLVEGMTYCRVIIKHIFQYESYADIILESPSTKDEINLRWEEKVTINPDEEGPISIPAEEGVVYDCNGCESDGKCYPLGYRKAEQYCTPDNEFVAQLEADASCDNNFECESNVCVSGECVSGGLIKKIMNWFKRLFGIKPKPPPEPVNCSELLIEKDFGDYKYIKSEYGSEREPGLPVYSKDGAQIDEVTCCIAEYQVPLPLAEYQGQGKVGVQVCPYNNRKDLENSISWFIKKEGFVSEEYKGQKAYWGGEEEVIIWTHNKYLLAVGGESPLPENTIDAYLDKHLSDLETIEIPEEVSTRTETGENCELAGAGERNPCYLNRARETNDVSFCEKIIDSQALKKSACYIEVAKLTKDINICKKITDSDMRERCYADIE